MDRTDATRPLSTLARIARAGMILMTMAMSASAARAQTFSTPGAWTYTVPSGVNTVQILVAGGGGGGAGGGNSNPGIAPGGAGGNGAQITAIISVTPGQVLSGTIGAGGVTGFSAGSSALGLAACSGAGTGGSGVGAGGRGANTNCSGTGASGGGGGGGGGTTFAVNGTVLLQAGGGGGAWGGGSASAGTTSTSLPFSLLCGTAATGLTSADFLLDGGGGGGGGGGHTAGLAGLSALDALPVGSGGGGGNCHNGSAAIKSMAVSADGGAGASGVPAITTSAGPAGGSGYVTLSTSAIAITTSSTTIQDLVSAANPKSIPSATMEHCFLMNNSWSTSVSGITISVQIASNQAYVDGSAKAGTTCAAATPAAGVTHNAGTLTLNTASIPANASYALVYQANVN